MPDKEMQEEMVGVLTAISIVSKRLANRLQQFKKQETDGEKQGITSAAEGREGHDES